MTDQRPMLQKGYLISEEDALLQRQHRTAMRGLSALCEGDQPTAEQLAALLDVLAQAGDEIDQRMKFVATR